jgi:hypothetical protein
MAATPSFMHPCSTCEKNEKNVIMWNLISKSPERGIMEFYRSGELNLFG